MKSEPRHISSGAKLALLFFWQFASPSTRPVPPWLVLFFFPFSCCLDHAHHFCPEMATLCPQNYCLDMDNLLSIAIVSSTLRPLSSSQLCQRFILCLSLVGKSDCFCVSMVNGHENCLVRVVRVVVKVDLMPRTGSLPSCPWLRHILSLSPSFCLLFCP